VRSEGHAGEGSDVSFWSGRLEAVDLVWWGGFESQGSGAG
jgi:hypothetical protein